jgi:RNA polymerase sigma factor (sigma-70 family)
VQDTFVRVAPRIDNVSTDHVAAYLRTVAVNLWKNRVRSLIRERRARERIRIDSATDVVGREDRVALRSAVWRLPKRQRACLVLRYYEDLPEREIADLLGCSIGTVKSQTSKALARLRREFQDEA